MEDAFIPEILDPQTNQPSDTGELILTTLVRTASPLFRYRTGDQVRAHHGPCTCGSENLALEGGILGRLDDMVVIRGVNIFPSAIEEVIRAFPEITEYRVLQKNSAPLTELQIEIEAPADTAPKLQKQLQTTFALRIPVTTVPSNTLPRSEMKSKRWFRES
jgi:phenylacetate-CoA ligase